MKGFLCLLLSTFILSAAQAETRYERVVRVTKEIHQKNAQNTELFYLKISDGDDLIGLTIGSGETNHFLVATHHGNEYGSTEVVLASMQDLARSPIPGLTIHVLPVLNTTGYNRNTRWERRIDANRDYPGPCGSREGPFSLESTKRVADFLGEKNIVTAITLHTHGRLLTYPWNFSTKAPTRHDGEFARIANLSATHNGYRTGRASDILYTTRGDFQDYAFWEYGIWPFLFELGTSHHPNSASIRKMINDNVPAIRELFVAAPTERAQYNDQNVNCLAPTFVDALDLQNE